MAKRRHLERGTIIIVPLDDFKGTISLHHAVILSPTDAIERGEPIVVAGISTTYTNPLPSWQHFMDYTAGHPHPDTGLSESCVVKGDWINEINRADIKAVFKKCKPSIVKALIEYINADIPPGAPSL